MNWLTTILGWFGRPPRPPVHQETTTALVPALNAERAKAGLAALVESSTLGAAALDWAKTMARNRTLTHGDFAARMAKTVPGHSCGENIAAGQSSVPEVVTCWMGSAGHRANILGAYAMAGHGEAADDKGVTYWCVDFAS